jgi:amino acid transporter
MELDELKYQLNQRLATDHASRSNADISALLKKKTHSVISKIKRSLIIEMVLCVLFFVAMLYVCFITNYWSIRVYFGVFTVLTVLMTLVLYYLYRRTDTLSDSDRPIKANLQTLVGLLEEFVKRYFQFTMALLPVCFMFSMILSYADPVEIPEIEKFSVKVFTARWQVMVFLGVYMIALAISVYYFTKWYLKKLYGNYLNELKQYIAELDQ